MAEHKTLRQAVEALRDELNGVGVDEVISAFYVTERLTAALALPDAAKCRTHAERSRG